MRKLIQIQRTVRVRVKCQTLVGRRVFHKLHLIFTHINVRVAGTAPRSRVSVATGSGNRPVLPSAFHCAVAPMLLASVHHGAVTIISSAASIRPLLHVRARAWAHDT